MASFDVTDVSLDSAALEVTLEDEWSAEEFQPVSGLQSGVWSSIAP